MYFYNYFQLKKHFLTIALIFGLLFALPMQSAVGAGGKNDKGSSNLLPMDTYVVNLSSAKRYLKVDLQLEFDAPNKVDKGVKETPRLRDSIIRVLTSKTADDLLTVEGKDTLRQELVKVVNAALGENIVTDVYFTNFVIQ